MLKFSREDVLLNQSANSKEDAIRIIGGHLTAIGKTEPGYVAGMLNRESQISTYLDMGVAIPHGVPEVRDLVKETGVVVVQFPQGVEWNDDGDLAYVCFGIASRSDEHLSILKMITKLIGDEEVTEALAKEQDLDKFLALLDQESASAAPASASSTPDLSQNLLAQAATELLIGGYVSGDFLSAVLATPRLPLGNGVLLASAAKGALENVVHVQLVPEFTYQGKPVKVLLTSVAKDAHSAQNLHQVFNQATNLKEFLFNLEATGFKVIVVQDKADASPAGSATSASPEKAPTAASEGAEASVSSATQAGEEATDSVSGVFVIHNEQGLHARPASHLVNLAKDFESKITVQNLTKGGEPVSAKSMVKVVSLGASKGSELEFVATGADASKAIEAIGKAIAEGLGE